MSTRITDSALYGHLWGTAGARTVPGEEGACEDMTDLLLRRARAARAAEPPQWPPPAATGQPADGARRRT